MKISFCIPTLNRGHLIEECLNSILCQGNFDFEIIIIDGGSTDETHSILDKFVHNYTNIFVYYSNLENGLGPDIISSIKHSNGKFCWLFSDDDLLPEGALSILFSKIPTFTNCSGITTNYHSYDKNLNYKIRTVPAIIGEGVIHDHIFNSSEECFTNFGMHLGFISSQIIRRELAINIIDNYLISTHIHSPWIIVYIIGFIQKFNCNWGYIHNIHVVNRTNNDSFLNRHGEYSRQLLTHKQFNSVISDLFNSNLAIQNVMKFNYLKYRMPRSIIRLKSKSPSILLQYKLIKLYIKEYRKIPIFWLYNFPLFFIPSLIYKAACAIYFNFLLISSNRP